MTRLALSTAALLIACTGCSSRTASTDAIDPEVQQLIHSYIEASNQADVDAVMRMIGRDPVATFIIDGAITRGWEEIRAENAALLRKDSGVSTSLSSIDVVPLGTEHALVTSGVTITSTSEEGPTEEMGMMTLVLEKSPEGWQIIHKHYGRQLDYD